MDRVALLRTGLVVTSELALAYLRLGVIVGACQILDVPGTRRSPASTRLRQSPETERPPDTTALESGADGPVVHVDPIEVFKALSDPVRWTVIQRLAQVNEASSADLRALLNAAKPTVSYHMKILIQAELVAVRKERRMVFYRLRYSTVEDLMRGLGLAALLGSANVESVPRSRSGPPVVHPSGSSSGAGTVGEQKSELDGEDDPPDDFLLTW